MTMPSLQSPPNAMVLGKGNYFGHRVRAREIDGLILTETLYRPRERIPDHRHARAFFCYVLDGSFVETVGRTVRECQRDRIVYHPPEEPHADRFGTAGGRCFNVEIDPVWTIVRDHGCGIPEAPAVLPSRSVTELAHRLYREFHDDDDLSPLAIHGLTTVLVAEAGRPVVRAEHRPPWIQEAIDLLCDRFAESLTLAEIANEVGVHPVYLARSFSRHVGATVHETIRRLRVERACELLRTTDRSIGEIAHAVGFFDHSHLTRTFRRELGITPSRYRSLRG